MKRMKKYLTMTFVLMIINIFCSINVLAASNPYKQKGPYGTNCTWYVWKQVNEKLSINLPMFGNAKDWYKNAEQKGYSVGTTPRANSIVVWGGWTEYGHVGFVESTYDNIINVWDSADSCIDYDDPVYNECMDNSYDEESSRACYAVAKFIACEYTTSPDYYGITGYIYLDNVPEVKVENTNKNTDTKKEESKPVEKEKSNNAYLSDITLSIGNIECNKDIFEYSLEIENEIEKIVVEATVEDSKAKVDGIGEYNLEIGLNEIKLIVTAEDSSTKEYVIKIVRKEKIEEKVQEDTNLKENDTKEEKTDNKFILLTISSSILFVVIVGIVLILYKKKHRSK